MNFERLLRYFLKVLQLLVTFVLLLIIGFPYWMIVSTGLLVPLYGMYLMFRSPDQVSPKRQPYAAYKLIAISKSWLKVDITLCLTMTVIYFLFSLLLFLFYFKLTALSPSILYSGILSLLLSILYTLNGLLITRQLQAGKVSFQTAANAGQQLEHGRGSKNVFLTASSKSSPVQVQRANSQFQNDDSFASLNQATNKLSRSRKSSDDKTERIRKKPAAPSPELPHKSSDQGSELKQAPKNPYNINRQFSTEKQFNRRVTSWFTDVGDSKKESVAMSESAFTGPVDVLKQDLDAREQYIKSKQYRDFMNPAPVGAKDQMKKSSRTESSDVDIESFNKKFSEASNEESESKEDEVPTLKSKLSTILQKQQNIGQNYKPATTPYARIPIPVVVEAVQPHEGGERKQMLAESTTEHYQIPILNAFNQSHTSSSNSELNEAFNSSLKSERVIDNGSYKASPVFISKKHPSNQTIDSVGEATPKAQRHGSFVDSIGVDDHPGSPFDRARHRELPSSSTFPSTAVPRHDNATDSEDTSLPSNSHSSLASKDKASSPESSIGSTVRIDDLGGRRNVRSPLRDSSMMTTSTIVALNADNLQQWSKETSAYPSEPPRPIYSQSTDSRNAVPSGKWDTNKKSFGVVIRSRDSPTQRPHSVSNLSTEFPSYSPRNSTTTLRIKSPPNYSQYNRHSSTQL